MSSAWSLSSLSSTHPPIPPLQTAELNAFVAQGSAMALCPNRDEILEAVGIIKPNVLLSVPTLFNRVSCCSSSPPADPPSPPPPLSRSMTQSTRRSKPLPLFDKKSSTLLWLSLGNEIISRSTAAPCRPGSSSNTNWLTRLVRSLRSPLDPSPLPSRPSDCLHEDQRGAGRATAIHRLWGCCHFVESDPILRRHRHPDLGGLRLD
jgi:hypothetical protein